MKRAMIYTVDSAAGYDKGSPQLYDHNRLSRAIKERDAAWKFVAMHIGMVGLIDNRGIGIGMVGLIEYTLTDAHEQPTLYVGLTFVSKDCCA